MKVGILSAIHPDESRVNWGGSPTDAYIRFLESANASFSYSTFGVALGELPDSPVTCDAYLITGSPRGVYDDDPWIADLSEFIRQAYQADRKLVGICFGHQILAQALGGRAEKSEKGWGLGLKYINLLGQKPWMIGQTARCSLYFAHQDQVTQLPPEAELLGSNPFCPNAFYTIDDRVFAIQGHPEFTASIMEDILIRVDGRVGKAQHLAAINSLKNGPPDNLLVAQWIVNFLKAS